MGTNQEGISLQYSFVSAMYAAGANSDATFSGNEPVNYDNGQHDKVGNGNNNNVAIMRTINYLLVVF